MTIEEEIIAVKEELDDLKQVAIYVKKLNVKLAAERERLKELEMIAEREYQDILDLEKKNFVDFFIDYSIEREKQKRIEEEEYLAAVMDCRNLGRTIRGLEFELKVLAGKVDKIPDVKSYLKALEKQVAQKLKESLKEARRSQDKTTPVSRKEYIHSFLETSDQVQLRLIEVESCLDKIETHRDRITKYPHKDSLRYIANLETVMIWLRSEMIQLETKLEVLEEADIIKDFSKYDVFSNYRSAYQLLNAGANNFMSAIMKNALTANNINKTTEMLRGYINSIAYELKQLPHYIK